jgi:hypothetical protein
MADETIDLLKNYLLLELTLSQLRLEEARRAEDEKSPRIRRDSTWRKQSIAGA